MNRYLKTAGLLGAAGAAYALYEPRRLRLQRHILEVPAGAPKLRVLHVSDSHLMGADTPVASFLRDLPARLAEPPALVIATGDLIETNEGIDAAIECFSALPATLGRFYVLGSHDYYQSHRPGYLKYLKKGQSTSGLTVPADTDRLVRGLEAAGYVSLTNAAHRVDVAGGRIALMGADDPHIERHRTTHLARRAADRLAIGVVHAPDIVSEFVLAGADLVIAGHTHAGQVRLPFIGSVVTNSSLPRELAAGVHRIGHAWLHVSPGLGHGRFSPIRFLARPEATLLELRPMLA